MSASGESVFTPGVQPWLARLGTVRDVVRQELVSRQLRCHLPLGDSATAPIRVLDVGCGQGTQAIRLARTGFHVTGIDLSRELLDRARDDLARDDEAVRQRIRLEQAELFDFAKRTHEAPWDAVCCHGVVMYLPSLDVAVDTLVRLARPGGLVSVLSRNQAGIAMRAGMKGRWRDAVDGFDAEFYRNQLGVADVRADRPEAVHAALRQAGAEPVAWYGVRLFTDHWESDDLPTDLDDLLAAEELAGRADPYRQVAALTHTVARRRG